MIRRRVFALALATLVAGCGFHPLYQQGGKQAAGLSAIYVNVIRDRSGQLLRQALQARLDGSGSGVAKHYALTVYFGESVSSLDVQADNSVTRNRTVGTAYWNLQEVDKPGQQIAGGTVRSVDGYNIIDEQFFYATTQADQTDQRLADTLADQIVTGLALYFNKHPPQG